LTAKIAKAERKGRREKRRDKGGGNRTPETGKPKKTEIPRFARDDKSKKQR